MNTSCKATFKDGTTKVFPSLQVAAEETGISEASIKIRCNKKGCVGKDKTAFEWIDEHTKRHFQAKKSKTKGSAWEYEVVKRLKEIGYEGCVTAKGESKFVDNNKIDIIDKNGELPCNIQCKNLANTPSYFAIRDACTDKSKPFVVCWKKADSQGNAVAIIPIDYFYQLISK